ncbi:tyrosine-protein phosphatase [Salinispirillum sp. LH 10-3-1]|uniref:Tyrosine-protein phosphatase n=1 Tax=Salinispirillum sp. LH 10-3-1 TaxID=2952525 RepID=A0AB38YJA9_9GAMM
MMVKDQGCFRPFFNRPVEIVSGIWRSNQPTPARLQTLSARGFRSVLNLRGESSSAYHLLEVDACQRTGLQLHNIKMSSRRPPTKEQLFILKDLFDHAPRPLLLHCKSGADRAGLVAGLFQLWSGVPVCEAKHQLSKRYLHFRDASTGVLDHFLEEYERAEAATGIGFWEWVDTQYDREAVKKSHRPKQGVSWWVDKVLRRE